jgi:hypothetical protein
MTSLINREATKRFILAKVKSMRPGMPISRVSGDAMDHYEARLRAWIVEDVRRHASVGKTFKAAYLVSTAAC